MFDDEDYELDFPKSKVPLFQPGRFSASIEVEIQLPKPIFEECSAPAFDSVARTPSVRITSSLPHSFDVPAPSIPDYCPDPLSAVIPSGSHFLTSDVDPNTDKFKVTTKKNDSFTVFSFYLLSCPKLKALRPQLLKRHASFGVRDVCDPHTCPFCSQPEPFTTLLRSGKNYPSDTIKPAGLNSLYLFGLSSFSDYFCLSFYGLPGRHLANPLSLGIFRHLAPPEPHAFCRLYGLSMDLTCFTSLESVLVSLVAAKTSLATSDLFVSKKFSSVAMPTESKPD